MRRHTTSVLGLLVLAFVAIFAISVYITNFVKLVDCDFESNYKCEIIHGLGVIPPLSFITVWFDTDS